MSFDSEITDIGFNFWKNTSLTKGLSKHVLKSCVVMYTVILLKRV